MKRLLTGLCGLLLAGSLLAGTTTDIAKQAEASMLVTGSVVVSPDGSVQSYLLDHPEKLPSGVVALIAKTVPTWTFQPVVVDGKVVNAKAAMSLRVVARKMDKDQVEARVAGVSFGVNDAAEDGSYKSAPSPIYPRSAIGDHVSGTVYLLLKIGRDGAVQDAAVEQVNLFALASERTMKRWRKELADASLVAARRWTFNPPTAGGLAGSSSWNARIPITYCLMGDSTPCAYGYGAWQGYVRGPSEPIPWLAPAELASGSVDATPDGGMRTLAANGLHLKTPLDGS
jgi:hypothetical protein